MTAQAWGAIVTLCVFGAMSVFYAGYLTARVKAIEEWRLEVRADFLQIQRALNQIMLKLRIEED